LDAFGEIGLDVEVDEVELLLEIGAVCLVGCFDCL